MLGVGGAAHVDKSHPVTEDNDLPPGVDASSLWHGRSHESS